MSTFGGEVAEDRAYAIVGAFLAAHRREWFTPGKLAALYRAAAALLDDGVEEDRIRRGLNSWHGAGERHSAALRSHVEALR